MNRKRSRSRWAEILGHDTEISGHVGPKYPPDALAALEAATPTPSASPSTLTQQHALIRSAEEYGDLFAHVATASAATTAPTATQSSESTQS